MSVECRECGMELTDKDIGEHEEMCVKCRGNASQSTFIKMAARQGRIFQAGIIVAVLVMATNAYAFVGSNAISKYNNDRQQEKQNNNVTVTRSGNTDFYRYDDGRQAVGIRAGTQTRDTGTYFYKERGNDGEL